MLSASSLCTRPLNDGLICVTIQPGPQTRHVGFAVTQKLPPHRAHTPSPASPHSVKGTVTNTHTHHIKSKTQAELISRTFQYINQDKFYTLDHENKLKCKGSADFKLYFSAQFRNQCTQMLQNEPSGFDISTEATAPIRTFSPHCFTASHALSVAELLESSTASVHTRVTQLSTSSEFLSLDLIACREPTMTQGERANVTLMCPQ